MKKRRHPTFLLLRAVVVAWPLSAACGFADDLPAAVSDGDFEALRKTSPFTRVLSLPETYALRGVARIGDTSIATLYNRETKKTIVITPDADGETGISLVDVLPADQLEEVKARISFAGDEAELRYETSQIHPAPKGPAGSGRADGERRGPSPQDIERFKGLPEEKQAKLREYIGHVMRNYPDMSREERGNLIRGAMVRLADGRELEVPKAPAQGQTNDRANGTRAPGNGQGREQGSGESRRNREGGGSGRERRN